MRLDENELINQNHLPVMMIFNMVDESRFMSVLQAVTQGIGFGEEVGVCTMPDDLDEFDKANGIELDGVEFALYSGEEVVIDFKTLYHYLQLVTSKFLVNNGEKRLELEALLEDYRNSFLV